MTPAFMVTVTSKQILLCFISGLKEDLGNIWKRVVYPNTSFTKTLVCLDVYKSVKTAAENSK